MHRKSDDASVNGHQQDVTRDAASRTRETELRIELLEERIAPKKLMTADGVVGPNTWHVLNRSETMSVARTDSENVELDVLVLEERIAPGIGTSPSAALNRSETTIMERAKTSVHR